MGAAARHFPLQVAVALSGVHLTVVQRDAQARLAGRGIDLVHPVAGGLHQGHRVGGGDQDRVAIAGPADRAGCGPCVLAALR